MEEKLTNEEIKARITDLLDRIDKRQREIIKQLDDFFNNNDIKTEDDEN